MTTIQTPTDEASVLATRLAAIDAHLAGYAEPDPVRRLELLRAAWAPGGELVDPPLAATGPEGIAAVVDAVLAHYPGHRFARTSELDAHHAHARYRWSLLDPAGTVVLAGTDVVTFDDGGRLVRVIGFFGEPAELVELGGGAG